MSDLVFLDDSCGFEHYSERHGRGMRTPAVFLDRDGVIIEEKHYLHDPEHVALYPGVAEKLRVMRALDVPVVLVTNQSGIGQAMFGWPEYRMVHQRMVDLIGMERPFTAVYANSHHPSASDAAWRKPNPGMILQAAADLNIDLAASVMVGDKVVDLQAAQRAGVERLVHVRTGHGVRERPAVMKDFPTAELINSLADLDIDCFRGE